MKTPSDLRTTVESWESTINWIGSSFKQKKWIRLFLIVDACVFLFLNEPFVSRVLKTIGIHWSPENIPHYYLIWLLTFGGLFAIALIAAITKKPRETSKSPAEDASIRGPLKFLRAFEPEDAQIFTKLQRSGSLRICLSSLTSRDFRFGVITGETGSGKTSFIRAGIIPAGQRSNLRCIYTSLTESEPCESLRNALAEAATIQPDKQPILLVFDQFEQFFVQSKLREQRETFIEMLSNWYQQNADMSLKVVLCIREDYYGKLVDLQQAMNCSLGPGDTFLVNKFTPDEATTIFRVISETEHINFDEHFVREMTRSELATYDDGLISAVDVQILAWVISCQRNTTQRAFTAYAYRKLGGVEGILQSFLQYALDALPTKEQRQNVMQVLTGLIDIERNVRAGSLTQAVLLEKLHNTMTKRDVDEAIAWLEKPSVRLVERASNSEGAPAYELAHERLIPAVRRIMNRELSQAHLVNILLDKRANQWLADEQHSRYLFGWSELRLIEKQRHYIDWGRQKELKEKMLAASEGRVRKLLAIPTLLLVVAIGYFVWHQTTWGRISSAKREMLLLANKKLERQSKVHIANALLKDGEVSAGAMIFEKMGDANYSTVQLLNAATALYDSGYYHQVSEIMARIAVRRKIPLSSETYVRMAQTYALMNALNIAEAIANRLDSLSKPQAFRAISQACITRGRIDTAIYFVDHISIASTRDPLLQQLVEVCAAQNKIANCIPSMNKIADPGCRYHALLAIGKASLRLGDTTNSSRWMKVAISEVDRMANPQHRLDAYIELGVAIIADNDAHTFKMLMTRALETACQIHDAQLNASYLTSIANAFLISGDTIQFARNIDQALQTIRKIEEPERRKYVLTSGWISNAFDDIVETFVHQGQLTKAFHYFISSSAKDIEQREFFADLFARAFIDHNDWDNALRASNYLRNPFPARTYIYKREAKRCIDNGQFDIALRLGMLISANEARTGVSSETYLWILKQMLSAYEKKGDIAKADAIIDSIELPKYFSFADQFSHNQIRLEILANRHTWKLALKLANNLTGDTKAEALSTILNAWAGRKAPSSRLATSNGRVSSHSFIAPANPLPHPHVAN